MNFFGHAVVASRTGGDAAFVFGAMLPDFASMARARIAQVEHAEVQRGIDHHHDADRRFHRLESFRTLCRTSEASLAAHGMRRGQRRASAHVAVELLLDGFLVDDEDAAAAYLAALERSSELAQSVRWKSQDGAARFRKLHARLTAHGVPHGYADPEVVADRVIRVLTGRPLIALDADEQEILRARMPKLRQRVGAQADALVIA